MVGTLKWDSIHSHTAGSVKTDPSVHTFNEHYISNSKQVAEGTVFMKRTVE